MSKLFLDQEQYDAMVDGKGEFSASYIAVDAYLVTNSTEAVFLGDLWGDVLEFDKRWEDEYFETIGELFGDMWRTAFGDEPLPTLGRIYTTFGGESEEWGFDDVLIQKALKKIRKFIIDRIYEVQPDA